MSKSEALIRYNHIIRKLWKAPCDYNELMDYLGRQSEFTGYKLKISKRTLARYREHILAIYNILISYNPSTKLYFIEGDSNDEAAARILESYDMLQALNLSDGLSKYVLFEQRTARGTEHFHGLLHAIQNNSVVRFTYEKYWDGTFTERTLHAYALKEFKGRWYAVGMEAGQQQVKTFSLDRITKLEILKQKFMPVPAFDAAQHFQHAFGIMAEQGPPPEVILSFDAEQGKYIRSYPLHHSQQVLVANEQELRISLRLHPTYDFLMELLAHNETVEVLAPELLQQMVKERAINMALLYKQDA